MSGILLGMFNGGADLDTQVVTVGQSISCDKYGCITLFWGYDQGSAIGSIADGTFNPKSGATILSLYYDTAAGGNPQGVYFKINGVVTNNGWNSVRIGSSTYSRSAATFTSPSYSQWYWSTTTNDFGTSTGASVTAAFS